MSAKLGSKAIVITVGSGKKAEIESKDLATHNDKPSTPVKTEEVKTKMCAPKVDSTSIFSDNFDYKSKAWTDIKKKMTDFNNRMQKYITEKFAAFDKYGYSSSYYDAVKKIKDLEEENNFSDTILSLYAEVLNNEKIKKNILHIHYLPVGEENLTEMSRFLRKIGTKTFITNDPSSILLEKFQILYDLGWYCDGIDFTYVGKAKSPVFRLRSVVR